MTMASLPSLSLPYNINQGGNSFCPYTVNQPPHQGPFPNPPPQFNPSGVGGYTAPLYQINAAYPVPVMPYNQFPSLEHRHPGPQNLMFIASQSPIAPGGGQFPSLPHNYQVGNTTVPLFQMNAANQGASMPNQLSSLPPNNLGLNITGPFNSMSQCPSSLNQVPGNGRPYSSPPSLQTTKGPRDQQGDTSQEGTDFTQAWEHGDMVFIVEDQKVYANKGILSMNSPVLKRKIEASFMEKGVVEIYIPGKTLDTFVDLMRAVHAQGQFKEKDCEKLLPLAHEYQMKHLLSIIEVLVLRDSPSVSRLVLADKYGLTKLREVCLEFAKKTSLATLKKDPMYDKIASTSKIEILEHHATIAGEGGKDPGESATKLTNNLKTLSVSNNILQNKLNECNKRFSEILALTEGTPNHNDSIGERAGGIQQILDRISSIAKESDK